jgi:starvation-inducible DNA-binding protein
MAQTASDLSTDAATEIAAALNQTLAGLSETAAKHGDIRTEDLAIERGRIHDKFAWMLRAHLR